MHANFHPHVNFLIMVTQQFFFPWAFAFTSVATVFSILVVIQLFRSASSCPYRKKDGLFGNKICNSLWSSSQPLKEFTQQQVKSSAGFIRHFWGVLRCFSVFWTISGIVFKADILSTDYFFKRQVSFVNPTLSVSTAATAPIEYRTWILKAIGAVEHNEPGLCAPWTTKNG